MHALIKVLSSSSSCQQLSMISLSEPPPIYQILSSPCLGMLRDILPVTVKPFLKKSSTASLTIAQEEEKKKTRTCTTLDKPENPTETGV